MKHRDWRHAVAAAVLYQTGTESAAECAAMLAGVLDARAIARFALDFADVRPAAATNLDAQVPTKQRRAGGVYFTPRALGRRLAEAAVAPDEQGLVVDLSCGDGALLAAAVRQAPNCALAGVERELVFAVAAAARLRGERHAQIVWDDGLRARPEWVGAVAVIGNPPYVGEKGNSRAFRELRARNPDLARWFGPRIDLHYLFVHRALDILRPGGRLAYLTSEYWLTASGANILRADLAARSETLQIERLGAGAFASAPGHHSLIFVAQRRAEPVASSGETWHPFSEVPRDLEGVRLGAICRDRQGFVSGADRVSNRLASAVLKRDRPIFIWHDAEVPEADRDLFRPLIRRADCVANRVWLQAPGRDWVLWRDGSESEELASRIEVLLEPFRASLEARREVRSGAMTWSRIWWPRRTPDYARAKLVVPRRCTDAAMCLDLSGSHVSSDCTFLLAPMEVDSLPWLMRVMLAANSPGAIDQLRNFGKTKGRIMEFYAQPLKQWALPLQRRGDRLRLRSDALESAARDAVVNLGQVGGNREFLEGPDPNVMF